jgi:hypothetical protein
MKRRAFLGVLGSVLATRALAQRQRHEISEWDFSQTCSEAFGRLFYVCSCKLTQPCAGPQPEGTVRLRSQTRPAGEAEYVIY